MNILVFKVNHLGDNVVFLPVVQQLRASLPRARLLVVTSPAEAELYRGVLASDEVFAPAAAEIFRHAWRRRPWAVPGWITRLAAFRADATLISYDQGNFAHGLARLLGGPIRVGTNMRYVRVRNSITHHVPPPADWCVAEWNWSTGRALAQALDPAVHWPDTPPAPGLRHLVDHPTASPRRVVIHAGTKLLIRQWPLGRFAELAARLSRDHEVLWVDRPETRGAILPPGVRAVAPDSLRELVMLVAGAGLYVGNNSGPMHVANALGTPGVIVSGPSNPGWDPYWHRGRWRVLRHPNLACLPCEIPGVGVDHCTNTAAPLACLQYWDVDRVESASRGLLAGAQA